MPAANAHLLAMTEITMGMFRMRPVIVVFAHRPHHYSSRYAEPIRADVSDPLRTRGGCDQDIDVGGSFDPNRMRLVPARAPQCKNEIRLRPELSHQ
jgi:hypothetical protein